MDDNEGGGSKEKVCCWENARALGSALGTAEGNQLHAEGSEHEEIR